MIASRKPSSPAPAANPWWRLLGGLAIGLAALLAGCGPGVGGTGTGPSASAADALAAFGASAAPLCGSTLAAGLQCASVGSAPGGLPGSSPGSTAQVPAAPLQFLADDSVAAHTVARVVGEGIELELACEGLRFSGTWGAVPGQPARFYGVVQRTGSGNGGDGGAQLATLSARADGDGITVWLADGGGTALAASRLLRPVPAALTAACPG